MKHKTPFLIALLLSASVILPAHAESAVKADMKVMGKSLQAAGKADDLATLKTELTKLRDAAKKAQGEIPPDLQKQAPDSPQRKLYAEGINKLLGEIDSALTLANTGKQAEAKAELEKIKSIRREYHKKLDV